MIVRHDLCWRATRSPDAPALEHGDEVWAFAELASRAMRAAMHVRAIAGGSDAPIGLLASDGPRFAVWFHAIAMAGRTVLPLNARLTAGELAMQLRDADAHVLLGEEDDPRLAQIAASVPGLHAEAVPPCDHLLGSSGASSHSSGRDAPLAVLYTSGTSGRAKGACLTWGNFAASARAAEARLGAAVSERWLACMPLFHVGGLSILLRSVRFGGPVRLQSRFDATAVSDALDAGDVAGVSLVPTMLSRLLDLRGARPAPRGLRVLLLGGAAAAPGLVARAIAAGYPVCPTYGLTEATSQVATAAPPRPGATGPSPMRPVAGVEVRIGSVEQQLPAGEAGEILVRGATVMSGYLNDPPSTARALRGGWLHTGDLGYLDDDGGLHVLDRRDDLVVSGGENVYPAEVEAVLLEHPDVLDAGVSGIADEDLGSRLVAWIILRADATADQAALHRHCRERLAGFKAPREYRFVVELPRNAAGKLQRRRLVG